MAYLVEFRDSESGDLTSSYATKDSLEAIKKDMAAISWEDVSSWEAAENEEQPDLLWQLETLSHFIHIRRI